MSHWQVMKPLIDFDPRDLRRESGICDPTGFIATTMPDDWRLSVRSCGITYGIAGRVWHGPHGYHDDAAVLFPVEARKFASAWYKHISSETGLPIDRLAEDTIIIAQRRLTLELSQCATGVEVRILSPGTRGAFLVAPDDSPSSVVPCVASMLGSTTGDVRIPGVTMSLTGPKRADGRGMLLGTTHRMLELAYIDRCGACAATKRLVHAHPSRPIKLSLCLPCAKKGVTGIAGRYVLDESNKLVVEGREGREGREDREGRTALTALDASANAPTGTDAVVLAVLLAIERCAVTGATGASPFAKLIAETPQFADLVAKRLLYNSKWSKYRVMCAVRRKLAECEQKLRPVKGPALAEFISDMSDLRKRKAPPVEVFEVASGHVSRVSRTQDHR